MGARQSDARKVIGWDDTEPGRAIRVCPWSAGPPFPGFPILLSSKGRSDIDHDDADVTLLAALQQALPVTSHSAGTAVSQAVMAVTVAAALAKVLKIAIQCHSRVCFDRGVALSAILCPMLNSSVYRRLINHASFLKKMLRFFHPRSGQMLRMGHIVPAGGFSTLISKRFCCRSSRKRSKPVFSVSDIDSSLFEPISWATEWNSKQSIVSFMLRIIAITII